MQLFSVQATYSQQQAHTRTDCQEVNQLYEESDSDITIVVEL
jgi:hypothetical protein